MPPRVIWIAIFILATTLMVFALSPVHGEQSFDFDRYIQTEDMIAALPILFPEGTERSYVEEKLVKEGGATIKPHEARPNVFYYQYTFPALTWDSSTQRTVTVMYYANDVVRQIWTTGSSVPVLPVKLPLDKSDATVFRFEDYDDPSELIDTLRALFPFDTPRSEVEKVLVNWAQASILQPINDPLSTTYSRRFRAFIPTEDSRTIPEERVWNVTVSYLDNDALSQIRLDGSAVEKGFEHTRQYFLDHKSISKKEKEH